MSYIGELQMKPKRHSQLLLNATRSKAKMYEYSVPREYHINLPQDPAKLFSLSIGTLGDLAAKINQADMPMLSYEDDEENLLFSAHFFDSYFKANLNSTLDPYFILLGSASYYLCDLPGSSTVLANRYLYECPDLGCEGLEQLLYWLLKGNLTTSIKTNYQLFDQYVRTISEMIIEYFDAGDGEENIIEIANRLRTDVYEFGTPRQLLFGDVISAVLRKKITNSCWRAIPIYSDISKEQWRNTLKKETFIKELWPAQHLMGINDLYKGASAIVQMPTSAGKTKSIEIIIRSAFLAERTALAIIVAPFRALCHEIKDNLCAAFSGESTLIDELTDAFQPDFDIKEILNQKQVIVVTPEKLIYTIRHIPEIVSRTGLVIFDEGHQFDNGTRGITYELLLTSLNSMLPDGVQKVLISAVISNAEAIGDWLIKDSKFVFGTNLSPTYRSIGFASWLDQRGRIEYVNATNIDQAGYYVPRVIESLNYGLNKDKIPTKVFPDKSKPDTVGKEVALYLGLKLMPEGSVAIFCGKKDSASAMCEMIAEKYSQNLQMIFPDQYSNRNELSKLVFLIDRNLGSNSAAAKSAKIGIFSHHGNTPHGIRLSIEHAMREGQIRFVICTSTLAQGVNLPIRYLIVNSVYQGLERIKVRDFINLIGRVGRAGMYTEGSILFADPRVYDNRNKQYEKWRWKQAKELLDPENSEPCLSKLLSIFEPLLSDNGKLYIKSNALDFAEIYISGEEQGIVNAKVIVQQYGDSGFTLESVKNQISEKIMLISSVESFLLSHWYFEELGFSDEGVFRLAESTLAYSLADEQKQNEICALFKLLADNISSEIIDLDRRKIYGRTLYGLRDAQNIEVWVHKNIIQLLNATDEKKLLETIWTLLLLQINNKVFKKINKRDVLYMVLQEWIAGKSYHDLLEIIQQNNAKIIWGTRFRSIKIDQVVDLCENGLAYDGALLIGAICEFVEPLSQEGIGDLIERLHLFQKQLKYGLSTEVEVVLYEMGFSDRVISQDIASELNLSIGRKGHIKSAIKMKAKKVNEVVMQYPSYFQNILNDILR